MLAGMIMRPRATSSRMVSGGKPLAARDVLHLLGDTPLPGIVDLRADTVAGRAALPIGLAYCTSLYPVILGPGLIQLIESFDWTEARWASYARCMMATETMSITGT